MLDDVIVVLTQSQLIVIDRVYLSITSILFLERVNSKAIIFHIEKRDDVFIAGFTEYSSELNIYETPISPQAKKDIERDDLSIDEEEEKHDNEQIDDVLSHFVQ